MVTEVYTACEELSNETGLHCERPKDHPGPHEVMIPYNWSDDE